MPFLCDTVRSIMKNDSSYQLGEGSQSQQHQQRDQEKRAHLQIPHFESEGRYSPIFSEDSSSSSSSSSSSDELEELDESEYMMSSSPTRYYRSVLDSSRQYRPVQGNAHQATTITTSTMYHKQSPPPKVFPLSLSPRLLGFGSGSASANEDAFSTGYFVPKQDAIQQQYMQGGLSRKSRLVGGGSSRRNYSRRQSLGLTV